MENDIYFNSVKECAEYYISNYTDKTNQQIAELVSMQMNTNTTAGCIAWYKSKIKNYDKKMRIQESDLNDVKKAIDLLNEEEEIVNDYEIKQYDNEAEAYFYKTIKNDYDQNIKKMKPGVGYDYEMNISGRLMHVEVKGKTKGKISWLQLTSKETEALLNDQYFTLAIVDPDQDNNKRISLIQRIELLQIIKIKLHARLNGLSAEAKRDDWDISNYKSKK